MSVLKTITDDLRRVQAERETQDLLEVLRRRLSVLTFGDLAGLITSALGKKLAAVKVSALFGPSADLDESPSKPPPASASAAATATPSKKPAPAAPKKAARKSKVKVKAKAKTKTASKRKAQPGKKAAAKGTAKTSRPPAKGKKAAAKAKAASPRPATGAQAAQDQAVLRALAASAEPLSIRGVVDGAKLSQSQANRTLRRLIDGGALRMIGPKQRATYTLAQRTGSGTGTARPSATPSPAADAPATSRAPGSKAGAAGSEAYSQAILAGLQSAGDWIRAADLRPQVGGTAEQLRLALVDLVRGGAIVKTGERNGTRYKLAG